MNITPKILLTIELEGVLGARAEKGITIPYNVKNYKGTRENGVKYHRPRTLERCYKKMVISKDSYDYFISNSCPQWIRNPRAWASFKEAERLYLHLNRIAENRDFTYEVLTD